VSDAFIKLLLDTSPQWVCWIILSIGGVFWAYKSFLEIRKTQNDLQLQARELNDLRRKDIAQVQASADSDFPKYESLSNKTWATFLAFTVISFSVTVFVIATQPLTRDSVLLIVGGLFNGLLSMITPMVLTLLKAVRHSYRVHTWLALLSLTKSGEHLSVIEKETAIIDKLLTKLIATTRRVDRSRQVNPKKL
jgi:hypothetical protein